MTRPVSPDWYECGHVCVVRSTGDRNRDDTWHRFDCGVPFAAAYAEASEQEASDA